MCGKGPHKTLTMWLRLKSYQPKPKSPDIWPAPLPSPGSDRSHEIAKSATLFKHRDFCSFYYVTLCSVSAAPFMSVYERLQFSLNVHNVFDDNVINWMSLRCSVRAALIRLQRGFHFTHNPTVGLASLFASNLSVSLSSQKKLPTLSGNNPYFSPYLLGHFLCDHLHFYGHNLHCTRGLET